MARSFTVIQISSPSSLFASQISNSLLLAVNQIETMCNPILLSVYLYLHDTIKD